MMSISTTSVSRATPTMLKELVATGDTILLDFRADWCAPCRSFGPVFAAAAERHPNIRFVEVDVDDEPQLADMFKVRSIPTIAAIRGGKLMYARPGGMSAKGLDDLIEKVSAPQ